MTIKAAGVIQRISRIRKKRKLSHRHADKAQIASLLTALVKLPQIIQTVGQLTPLFKMLLDGAGSSNPMIPSSPINNNDESESTGDNEQSEADEEMEEEVAEKKKQTVVPRRKKRKVRGTNNKRRLKTSRGRLSS